MPPTLTSLPFPTTSPDHFVHIISSLLTPSECASIINSHTDLIPSNVTPGTIRTRVQFTDPSLAAVLWSRLCPFYLNDRLQDEEGSWWRLTGLNDHFRLGRYEKGGKFSPHFDSRHMASVNEQSFMTVNMYLNTVPQEHRGATRVLVSPSPDSYLDDLVKEDSLTVLAKIQPVLGTAAVFRDSLWHDGEELLAGEKYLLRTDVMYEREVGFDFEGLYGGLSEGEKGVKAMGIAEALEDGGSREEAVRWYKKALKLRGER